MTNKKKAEPVEVAVYDRALLEHHEVQPVATQDGHTITVDSYGRFGAILGDVTVSESTLEKAKERVHTSHLAQERKRKKKAMAVPAFILDRSTGGYGSGSDREEFCGEAFFRGVHAGHGALQYAHPDGTKAFSESVTVWPRGHRDAEEVLTQHRRMVHANAVASKAQKALGKLVKKQQDRMFRGMDLGYGSKPKVGNDAKKADELADTIVANVLTKPDED